MKNKLKLCCVCAMVLLFCGCKSNEENVSEQTTASSEVPSKSNEENVSVQTTASSEVPSKSNEENVSEQTTASSEVANKSNEENVSEQTTASSEVPNKSNEENVSAQTTASSEVTSKSNEGNVSAQTAASSEVTKKETSYAGYEDFETSFDADRYLTRREGIDYGRVEKIEYYSNVANKNRTAYVMLPAGYDGTQSYPVLYWAHGINCGPSSYSDLGAMEILHNLIAEGKAVPMIMVGTDNYVSRDDDVKEEGISYTCTVYDRALSDITESLMPYINSHYKVKTGKENTAISGFSMGGRTALYLGFARQDLFGYVGAVAPAPGVVSTSSNRLTVLLDGFKIDEKYGDFKFLMLVAGKDDTLCGPATEKYDEILTQSGIKHMYYRCDGAHESKVWQSECYNFLKRIFK